MHEQHRRAAVLDRLDHAVVVQQRDLRARAAEALDAVGRRRQHEQRVGVGARRAGATSSASSSFSAPRTPGTTCDSSAAPRAAAAARNFARACMYDEAKCAA